MNVYLSSHTKLNAVRVYDCTLIYICRLTHLKECSISCFWLFVTKYSTNNRFTIVFTSNKISLKNVQVIHYDFAFKKIHLELKYNIRDCLESFHLSKLSPIHTRMLKSSTILQYRCGVLYLFPYLGWIL